MPTLVFQPATVPVDAPFPPANAQALINFVTAYIGLSGLETLSGVLVSATEPPAADRDKVWVKRDGSSGRALGLFVYNGGWLPVPFILPSGEAEPAGGKLGELFYNTQLGTIRLFNGSAWTTNFHHTGDTAARPEAPPLGYLYFDTTINRLLRFTARGWSTYDGGLGDIKMVDLANVDDALAKNPGWVVFLPMAGRFPIGPSDDLAPQAEGGATLAELKLDVDAKRLSAQGGVREANATFISELTLNGVVKNAFGTAAPAPAAIGSTSTLNLQPPYKALIFLRKDF